MHLCDAETLGQGFEVGPTCRQGVGTADVRPEQRPDGYVGSDHKGDRHDKKSTAGLLTALVNQRGTFAAIDRGTKKQGAAAFSTPDAETTALQDATLQSTMPLLSLLEHITGPKHKGKQRIDNDAARAAVNNGASLKMKYIRRHQGVSTGGLHHIYFDEGNEDGMGLERIDSDKGLSDGFTKALQKDKFKEMRRAIGVEQFDKLSRP